MKVEIRSDRVHISGYVNAVERWSRPLTDRSSGKRFVERICAGTFADALGRNDKVGLMLNHDRVLDDAKSGRFKLEEDNIGLRFDGDVFDQEVIKAARKKELVGWSFGFYPIEQEDEFTAENGVDFKRTVRKLALDEVSIIDKRLLPAYSATSVEVRCSEETPENELQLRADDLEIEYSEEETQEDQPAEAPEESQETQRAEETEEQDTSEEKPEESTGSDYKRAILRKRLEIAYKC